MASQKLAQAITKTKSSPIGSKLSASYKPTLALSKGTASVGSSLTPYTTSKNPTGTTPTKPSVTAQPFDPAGAAKNLAAQNNANTANSDLDVDLQTEAQRVGFQYDPVTHSVGGIDPNNPFSAASLLQSNYDKAQAARQVGYSQSSTRTHNQLAGQGQLYSGVASGAQAELNRQNTLNDTNLQSSQKQGYDALQKQFQDFITKYLRSKRNISNATTDTLASTPLTQLENS